MSEHEIRPGIRRLFRLAVRRPDAAAAEADEEIRLHLALRAAQLEREGLTAAEARAEAERRFGPVHEARGRLHESAQRREERLRLRDRVESLAHDARVALRSLRRAPGFAAVAVLCIALGVGANAAAFSVFEELLLRPLPVPAADRLVNVTTTAPILGTDQCNQSGTCDEVLSLPMFRDLSARRGALASLAAHRIFLASVAPAEGAALQADGVFVTGEYFRALGLAPAAGRLLGPQDDVAAGAHAVAVVSHAYWTTHLGADPAAVGKRLLVNGRALELVGVAPRGFDGTTLGMRAVVWVPMLEAGTVDPFMGGPEALRDREQHWVYAFGRLRDGATAEAARAELTAAMRPILRDVELALYPGISARTRQAFLDRAVEVTDGSRGQSTLRGSTRLPALLLFGITGLVVLIACANIANLLLVRGAGRAAEIAVRMSLGAGRRRLVLQLLGESAVLAVVGGAASLLVAQGLLRLIASFIPDAAVGFGISLSLELRPSVLLFAGAVSVGTGLVFGLFPALHATRADLIAAIRAGAGQIPGGARAATRFRAGMVTAQIAMSLALLGCAGLFVKSLRNVGDVDLGMEADRVVQFALLPALSGYEPARAHATLRRVEDELSTLPGVQGVAASSTPFLTNSSNGGNVSVEGFARGPDTDANVRTAQVGPGFFRTMGIPMLRGRDFSAADRAGAPKVAVVNEAFARKFGLGARALGARLGRDGRSPEGVLDIQIVGVVRDANYSGVKQAPPPMLYTPYRQDTTVNAAAFYVRAAGAPAATLRAIPGAVARIDRTLPVAMLKPLAQQARESVYLDRMVGTLSAGFAALATLLAAVGLFGVLAYTVAQRRREIGVRMALGADAGRVRGLVLRQMGAMVLAGGALGLAGALGLGRLAGSLLFGLAGDDPAVLAASTVVVALVALAAAWLPAVRASRIAPATALRAD
ncbi:ABC transporter permease [Roseisolibacter sp. H3M3-2]|uniref:ABC transporter permease n=1 Tax=Roseisolibacter sp. H3M3-2 TaxID=3031323 RepID=UPI0023DC7D9E|nr:ABC transporter permease [Roseisolibacter sp. H3M3-2]MDF1504725.1 ABC transporter permease [Roseisolibacter sp. H3M3-2]